MLPPHNVVVEDHPEISHEALAMMPGEEFDVTFPQEQVSTLIGVVLTQRGQA